MHVIYFVDMRLPRRLHLLSLLGLAVGLVTTAAVVPPTGSTPKASAADGLSLEFLGRANSGVGNAGSEIAAFDAASKRLFVTNGATNKIDFFDISNPSAPVFIKSADLGALGVTGIQSVASKSGLVAAAAAVGGNNQAAGKVFLMDVNGTIDPRAAEGIVVGSLPDSVHFSPDGKTVLSANEGEPRDYCLTDGALPTTTDPHGSVSIIDVTAKTLTATTLDFAHLNSRAADIRTAGGRIYGPGATVAQDMEPEYIAISADSKKAFVTLQENNSVAEIDIAAKKIVRVLGLGYKDFNATGNGLDPSDQDSSSNGGINIANWPVKGMYEPDAIAAFTDAAGDHYFATANEGDAREYKCLLGGLSTGSAQAEDARVSSVGVDGTILASTLATNSNLGRLGMTRFEPSTYTNGGNALTATSGTDFTSLYTLGARSLTIWKSPAGTSEIAGATVVADTGDMIERKIAEILPNYFGADWNTGTGTPNAKDTRSDNKGPEPEGLAIGKVYGRTVAFVGLERIGGVMAFDITNPTRPEYLNYVNSSVFTGVGGANFATAGAPAGDVSPEGVLFVKATDSPTGEPLLIVAHELSGTTAIYKIVGTPTNGSKPLDVTARLSKTNATVSWTQPEDDGGRPITSYVVTSSPDKKFCTTTKTSCVVKGLRAGVKYTFTVNARSGGALSASSLASSAIQVAYFPTNVGSAVTIAKQPAKNTATSVGIFTKNMSVSVAAVTPKATVKTKQVVRYAIELWNASGKKVSTSKVSAGVATTATAVLTAPQKGRYRVVIIAGLKNGSKTTWNGPFVALK
jgi:hypothetical protein